MLFGKLKDGTLTNIYNREPIIWPDGGVDVEVVSQNTERGPFKYDPVLKEAIFDGQKAESIIRDSAIKVLDSDKIDSRVYRVLCRIIQENHQRVCEKINEIITESRLRAAKMPIVTFEQLMAVLRNKIGNNQ